MRVSVFGLGYVGAVSAACLSRDGHVVYGVDSNSRKVETINSGNSPIVEDRVGELIAAGVASRRLIATASSEEAVSNTDLSIVSVGTPSLPNGDLDCRAIVRVASDIGKAISRKKSRHVVAVRSTVLPGTVRSIFIPSLENASGMEFGKDFGVCFNPEFLREGSSVKDYDEPPYTLVGGDSETDTGLVARLYENVGGAFYFPSIETAEFVKYACNAFHAMKITFANEIGMLCQNLDVDSHEVMDIVCKDKKLNISSRYLTPGFAFGGSCLPKDLRALNYAATSRDLELPALQSLLKSNKLQVERVFNKIVATGKKQIGVLGISFKSGTDDLRESPLVSLVEALIGKGCDLAIYDKEVSISKLLGANKEFIEREIPHISSLLRNDIAEVINHSELLIVGNNSPEFAQAARICPEGIVVFDLVRMDAYEQLHGIDYQGVAW